MFGRDVIVPVACGKVARFTFEELCDRVSFPATFNLNMNPALFDDVV